MTVLERDEGPSLDGRHGKLFRLSRPNGEVEAEVGRSGVNTHNKRARDWAGTEWKWGERRRGELK